MSTLVEYSPNDSPLTPPTTGWHIENVISGGSGPPAIAIDSSNVPHILACPPGEVWYLVRQQQGWTKELVATTVAGGVCGKLVLGPSNEPHITFPPRIGDPGQMYGVKNNGSWKFRPVPFPVSSLTVDSVGTPHIATVQNFLNGTQLRYAYLVNDTWSIEYADFLKPYSGFVHWASLVLNFSEQPTILYYSANTDEVRYTIRHNNNWQEEVVTFVGNIGRVGRGGQLRLGSSETPMIVYSSGLGPTTIHYANRSITGWISEIVDDSATFLIHPTMVLTKDDTPCVTYEWVNEIDAARIIWDQDLIFRCRQPNGWSKEVIVDGLNDQPADYAVYAQFPDSESDQCGNPHLTYYYNWNVNGNTSQRGVYYATKGNCTSNRPPTVNANGPYAGHEGTPLTFAATATDPDNDILVYRWDFDNDGTADTTWSSSPTTTHTWPDDHTGTVRIEVSDGNLTANATATVTILNLPPTIDTLACTIERRTAEAWLRIAGEKWHDVSATLYRNGTEIGNATIVRRPGSPNDQEAYLGTIDTAATYDATVLYTPDDDPVNGQPNGATPAWIILRKDDGGEERLHHTFNARHQDTWVWTVTGLEDHLAAREVTCTATATDPGMDDLTFTWDWGDGSTVIISSYPNGGSFPFTATDVQTHTYSMAGVYDVKVRATDDDGGVLEFTVTLIIA